MILFSIFCVGVMLVGWLVIRQFWTGDAYYSQNWQAPVNQSSHIKQIQNARSYEKPSNQPKAPGFKESEIDKSEGKGYRTY